MITVKQIDRLWAAKSYSKLLEQLMAPRPETSGQLLSHLCGPLPAAAMAVIRLDELTQSFASLYGELVRTILRAQRTDGGWGDVMTTAVCIRALLCGNGNGQSIDRGLACVAGLQKPEGIWPNIPARRMPADAFASAFVLLRLGDNPQFRQAMDIDLAMRWFETNEIALDTETRRLWTHAQRRVPATAQAGSARTMNIARSPSQVGFWDFTAALSA